MCGIKSRTVLPMMFHVTKDACLILSLLVLMIWVCDPALAQDETQPLFTREGTLACPISMTFILLITR